MRNNRHWLLTMAMLLSSIMVSAHDFEVDGIYYNILSSSEKTVEVTYEGDYPHLISYTPEYSGEVVIPASVTYNSTPYDVVSINEYTFSNCTNLTSVSIPSSVTTIEECIFEACNNLVTIIVDENNKVFDSRDNCNAIITTVNNTIVQGCIGTIIPSSVTEIGKKAFATFYKGLTSVTIPENIVRVGEQAFAYCHELSTIHITFGVEEIGEGAFFDCKELLSISLPNSVTKIGKDAFYCCENLTSAVIPDNIPSIDEATFYGCRKMESISIGSGVTMIGASAFQDCVMLSSVVIPANVTEIATSAFIYCSNLSSIALLNPNAPSLGDMVFNGVPSSAVLYVPYGATQSYVDAGWGTYFATIEEKPIILASGDCSDPSAPNTVSWEVSYTDNPDNCTLTIWGNGTINPYVSIYDGDRTPWEEYKSDLKTLIIEDGITYIPDEAFDELNYLETLTIGKDVSEIHSMAFEWCSSLKSISVDENNTTFDSRDNCNAIIFTSSESLILGCCNTAIPEGVKKIAGGAFIHRADMQEIEFPSTLIEIGGEAFSYTSLDKVFIPASVESVAGNSFYGVALTSIVVDEENTKYDSREDCNSIIETATNKLVLGCTNTTIPEGVEVIAEFAFTSSWDPEKVLSIPSSVTSIEALAFYHGMTSALKEVVCYATTPPVLAESAFCLSADNIPTLRVPASSVEAYKAADGWKEFYIEPIGGVLVTSLTLDVTEASLAPNETLSLTATLLPEDVTNPALSWTSSNESVATVDANGVITAIAVGDATITVSTTDGSELSASCDVSVKISGICGENLTWVLDEATGILTIYGEGEMYDYNHLTENQSPWKNYSIKEVIVEEGVTSIGGGAFAELYYSECDVASVSLPEGLESIGGAAFSGCSLSEINFPSTLKYIGGEAFGYCSSLEEIYIPASVVSVAGYSFYGVALTSIVVDEENTKYDSREDCNSIIETATNKLVLGCTNTTIPEGVEVIAEFAFTSSWDPEKVLSIPSSVTSIEALAFYHGMTSALKEVVCYATTPPVLAESAFCLSADNIPTLRVPASSVEAYKAADGWKEFYIEPIGGVLVTSLTLDITEASLAPNETLELTATLLPEDVTNPALSWASSNESAATVNANGVVTAVADGEATITVSTTDGSDLSTSCKVVIVTKEVVEYDNMIYFEDVTVFTNSSVNHPLQLKNTVDMTAVQFDLYLPEGVTLATDARGRYAITFNADRADNTTHTLSSALQSDGAIRVLCYSTESYDFLGSEGAIFYFPLEIAEMEDGDYDMVIKNIVLTDVSGKKYEISSMTSTITVLNVAPGDCNGDNTIDVADIVVLANSILGNTADGFVEKAADYNADGAVDVADIVNIANYILNGNNAAARALVREMMSTRAAAAGYSFDIQPFVLDAVGSKTIAIELTDPTESFTAFQCDLYLPEGISVDKDNRGRYAFGFNEERTDASFHTLSSALQADGAIRVLCYSANTYNFLGTEGALLNIPLTAETSLANGVYEFAIANTVLTYVDGVKVMPETYKGSIVVGDGGKVENVKLYGRYTSEVLDEYTAAFGTNAGITSLDLTEALYLPAGGSLTTGNPNTIVYLAEGDALANENNVVVGDECANLMLADGYAFSAPVAFNAPQASYERELAEGKYGTIVLPFAPNTDDYVFYALTSVGDDALIFDEVQSPVANTPYLYKLRDGKSATQITNNEAVVSSELTPTETATWQMVGSFTNQTIVASEDADTYYYVYTSSDNQLHKVTNTLTVKPYRAYFTTNSTNGTQLAIRTRGGEETLIDAAEVEGLSPEVYYDLSGRRVDNPVKGVYIVNGKKVVF